MKRGVLVSAFALLAVGGLYLTSRRAPVSISAPRAEATTQPSAVSAPAPRALPAPVPSPPKVISVERSVDKTQMKTLKMPKGYRPEQAFVPKRWHHPTSLQAALEANPALADKLKQRAPEIAGMVDFKLRWLPRFATCVGDRVTTTEPIAIDFKFGLGDGESWVGRSANISSNLSDEDQSIVLECATKTFVGVERPIMDDNHGEGYLFRTQVRLPADNDAIYNYIR